MAVAFAAGGERSSEVAPEPLPLEVPPPLGETREELGERFGEALRPVAAERAASVFEQIAPGAATAGDASPPPGPAQVRLARPCSGDVRRVEYDLAGGRVYRVRWQLAERFARPILEPALGQIAGQLGRPDYDQTLRAELGSERADLRRVGWTRGRRALEVRQLHPFTGGPVFLSVSDLDAMQAVVDAGGVVLPQPDRTGAWWRRPQRPPELPSAAERSALSAAIARLMGQLAAEPDDG